MDPVLSMTGLAGADAMLALKVEPPISTSIVIGEPPNAVPLTPPHGFFKVGQFPCKIRLAFRFRMRPWSLEILLPNGSSLKKQDEREGVLQRPDRIVVYVDFTTTSNTNEI